MCRGRRLRARSAARRRSSRAIYRDEELDFAGTCVGVVERARLVDGSKRRGRRRVVGFASAGVHANGFTLVRRILEADDYDGDDLLAPTRLYLDEVRRLRDRAPRVRARHGRRHRGQPRARRPGGLRAAIDWDAWARPTGLRLAGRAHVDGGRAAPRVQPRHRLLRRRRGPRRASWSSGGSSGLIGVLVSGEGTNLQALIDAGLPLVGRRVEPAPASRALERAERAGIPTARLRRSTTTATREQRDVAHGRMARERGVELVVSPATCTCCAAVPRPLPRPHRQHAPGAAARLPRRAPDRGRARGRRRRDRRDRPLGRRGHRHGPGDRAERCRSAGRHRARRCARGSRPSSTASCPRSSVSVSG